MNTAIGMNSFQQHLKRNARSQRVPLVCTMELTPVCNLRCHFCYIALEPYKGPYLSLDDIKVVFDKLERGGVLWLTLTGGEIFSRRDFPEIYAAARAKGFLVTLFSNATMVSERIVNVLREDPPYAMEVSIYGADAEHYEGVTGIPGSFKRFERGMQMLLDAGIKPHMKSPISKVTEHHLPAMHAWCQARGLTFSFNPSLEESPTGGPAPTLYRLEPRRNDELRAVAFELKMGRPRPAMPLAECADSGTSPSTDLYQCSAGRTTLFVDALGQMSHCVLDRDPSFSLLDMEFHEIWERIGDWVTQPLPPESPCSGCGLRGGCSNCPARSRNSTGSPYLKDTYHCDTTHAMHGLEPEKHPDYRAQARQLGACAV